MNRDEGCGPEWDGPDRGTNSKLGCLLSIITMLITILIIAWLITPW